LGKYKIRNDRIKQDKTKENKRNQNKSNFKKSNNGKKLYICEAKIEEQSKSLQESEVKVENHCKAKLKSKEEESMSKVSLATVMGIIRPKTLQVKSHIKKRNITILIDFGSTHNFIDIDLAGKLNSFVYLIKEENKSYATKSKCAFGKKKVE
jgi:hypothetical protein